MLSLTRADTGMPVASFGTGTPFSTSQTQVNPGTFAQPALFGGSLGVNGSGSSLAGAATTATRAASTGNLGYQDLTQSSSRLAAHAAPMTAVAPQAQVPYTKQDTQWGAKPAGDLAKKVSQWGPTPAPGETTPPQSNYAKGRAFGTGLYNLGSRVASMRTGATEARDGSAPAGLFGATGQAGDLSEDAAL